jgi:hypothetical protein
MYMMWFDDSKKPVADKLAEGAAAYHNHFRSACNVVLVSDSEQGAAAPEGITIRAVSYVRRNNYWFGWEEVLA